MNASIEYCVQNNPHNICRIALSLLSALSLSLPLTLSAHLYLPACQYICYRCARKKCQCTEVELWWFSSYRIFHSQYTTQSIPRLPVCVMPKFISLSLPLLLLIIDSLHLYSCQHTTHTHRLCPETANHNNATP